MRGSELHYDLGALVERVRLSNSMVVLTGAGVSTESGLPDYRGSAGIWRNRRFAELADLATFKREPAVVWSFYRGRLDMLAHVEPNPGHVALATLERAGIVKRLLTQNVDGLHRRAGSRDLLELHGRLDEAQCTTCGRREPTSVALRPDRLDTELVPRCGGCGDPMKPGVVMFGEALDEEMLAEAHRAVEDCDLLLCVGSSLQVWPVAELAEIATQGVQNHLAILNVGPTAFDTHAALVVSARAGEALPELVSAIGVASAPG